MQRMRTNLNLPVKRMARIAMLAAVLYVSKVILEFAPNVELVSLFTILFTLVFGKEAFVIVTVFNMFELIQWGFGVWWVSYLYTWPLLCLLTFLLRRAFREEFVLWAVFSGGFGLLFGALFAVAYLPVGLSYAVSYWISGLPWDVWHGLANFVLMLVIGKPLYRVLKRLKMQVWS